MFSATRTITADLAVACIRETEGLSITPAEADTVAGMPDNAVAGHRCHENLFALVGETQRARQVLNALQHSA